MTIQFKLPDIGEGVAEGEIVRWLVAAGDAVDEHQPVVEVMTDKATVEIPAPAGGVVSELLANPGDVVPVGDIIFLLDSAGGAAPAPAAESAPAEAPAPAPAAQPSGEVIDFKLPDIGEGVAEGEIVRWIAAPGATVAEHEPVVEVMTDKATVEIPAPAPGVVTEHLVSEGDTVPVGTVIFKLAQAGGASAPAAPAAPAPAPTAAATSAPAPAAPARPADAKVLAVPSARRVARELGVDLHMVPGTGNNGVVRRADVEAYARGAEATAPASAPQQTAAASAPAAAPAPVAPLRAPTIRRPLAAANDAQKAAPDARVRKPFKMPRRIAPPARHPSSRCGRAPTARARRTRRDRAPGSASRCVDYPPAVRSSSRCACPTRRSSSATICGLCTARYPHNPSGGH